MHSSIILIANEAAYSTLLTFFSIFIIENNDYLIS